MLTTTRYSLIALAAALALTACGDGARVAEEPPVAETPEPDAVPTGVPTPPTWACPEEPGRPPSGELVAERLPNTAPGRDQAGLYEGPAWIDGALYFSDFTFESHFPSRIQRFDPETGELTTAIDNSGSNGAAIDRDGYLLSATHDLKAISRYNPHTGDRELIVNEFEGEPFNSPNDLVVTDEGVIFFTDPDFQRSAGPGEQPKTRVYRVAEDGVTVVDESMYNPNGIALSPDQNVLYVSGDMEDGVLRRYPLVDGVPGEGEDIASLSTPDGIAIDCLGNIYATEHTRQRIQVFTPDGDSIATIAIDANITNAAFGGADRKTLYITGAGALWAIELDIAGYPY
ncbi:SMP-30/gluconolactonase/LRE family protein [Marinimicrobium alkaliphilum]|uniref:SMP-30/gluconolactonase/LRE family protein n=1 Tax=Marinimicrobium alkaliphilum TaxID=2202654 RepID=UPI000DB90D8E|nr:SMP-30/gluconolactonase/LRE family protein [Marinimicrobium alkaliphilum]